MKKELTKRDIITAGATTAAKSKIMNELIDNEKALLLVLGIYTVELAKALFDEDAETETEEAENEVSTEFSITLKGSAEDGCNAHIEGNAAGCIFGLASAVKHISNSTDKTVEDVITDVYMCIQNIEEG